MLGVMDGVVSIGFVCMYSSLSHRCTFLLAWHSLVNLAVRSIYTFLPLLGSRFWSCLVLCGESECGKRCWRVCRLLDDCGRMKS